MKKISSSWFFIPKPRITLSWVIKKSDLIHQCIRTSCLGVFRVYHGFESINLEIYLNYSFDMPIGFFLKNESCSYAFTNLYEHIMTIFSYTALRLWNCLFKVLINSLLVRWSNQQTQQKQTSDMNISQNQQLILTSLFAHWTSD